MNKTRRPVCIVLSILAVALIAYMILRVVVPELVNAVILIGQSVPPLVEGIVDWLVKNMEGFPQTAEELENLQIDWNALGDTVWQYLKSGLSGVLNSTVSIVSGVIGGTIHFVISLIFSIYLLSSKEKLGRQAKALVRAYVKPELIERGRRIVRTADQTFSSFIVGQVTEAVILGTLCNARDVAVPFPVCAYDRRVYRGDGADPVGGGLSGRRCGRDHDFDAGSGQGDPVRRFSCGFAAAGRKPDLSEGSGKLYRASGDVGADGGNAGRRYSGRFRNADRRAGGGDLL